MSDLLQDHTSLNRFAIVPEWLLYHPKLSNTAKCIYMTLIRHAREKDSCFPGQERIGKLLCISRKTIYTELQKLKEVGLIEIKSDSAGRHKTLNTYILLEANESNIPIQNMSKPEDFTHSNGQILPTKDTQSKDNATGRKSPMRAFTDWWCKAFSEEFGHPYVFHGARDGKAAEKLVKLFPMEDLQDITMAGWKNGDPWLSKMSRDIAGLAAVVNRVVVAKTGDKYK